jgi:DNA-binding CsgD family transcriptional regulator
VRIELACGAGPAAAIATRRLRDAADGQPTGLLRGLAEHAAGLVARADGAPEAVGHLETALGAFGRLGLPLEEGRARLDLADVLLGERPVVATAEARAALETFRRLGAARDVDAATSLLRRLGVRGHGGPRGNGTLTVREEEVLALLGEGRGNTDIAATLHLSRRTVEHHVSNILAKLGLTGRAEVGAYVARRRA